MRFNIAWSALIFLGWLETSCSTKAQNRHPIMPAGAVPGGAPGQETGSSPPGIEGREGEIPGQEIADPALRRRCLEEQQKTLETWGWSQGKGVEGIIDLLLDESQEVSELPKCSA